MNWILLNIPLGALMVAFTVGLPLWVMVKYPDGDDTTLTAAPVALEHTAPAARSVAAITWPAPRLTRVQAQGR
jgi:hypothetical protein